MCPLAEAGTAKYGYKVHPGQLPPLRKRPLLLELAAFDAGGMRIHKSHMGQDIPFGILV